METWNIWAVHSREWWDMGVILSCVNEAVWHVEDVKSSVLSKLIISRNETKSFNDAQTQRRHHINSGMLTVCIFLVPCWFNSYDPDQDMATEDKWMLIRKLSTTLLNYSCNRYTKQNNHKVEILRTLSVLKNTQHGKEPKVSFVNWAKWYDS